MIKNLKQKTTRASAVALLLTVLVFTIASAAAGAYNTSFGVGGKATADNGDVESGGSIVFSTSNQKIYVGSSEEIADGSDKQFQVARFNANGTLDTTFDGDGYLTIYPSGSGADDILSKVAVDNNMLYVYGKTDDTSFLGDPAIILYRYSLDGVLDTTFGGGDGIFTIDPSSGNDSAAGLAFMSDHRIVIGGTSVIDNKMWVAVLTTAGEYDTSFSDDGFLDFHFSNNTAKASALKAIAVQPADNKIVLAGFVESATMLDDAVAVRLNTNGAFDNTFSSDGKYQVNFASSATYDSFNDILIDNFSSGVYKIVLVGTTGTGQYTGDFLLVRLKIDGSLDKDGSGSCKKKYDIATTDDEAFAVGKQTAKIGTADKTVYVLAGQAYDTAVDSKFATMRVLSKTCKLAYESKFNERVYSTFIGEVNEYAYDLDFRNLTGVTKSQDVLVVGRSGADVIILNYLAK